MSQTKWYVVGFDYHNDPVWDVCYADNQKSATRFAEVKYNLGFASAHESLDKALARLAILERLQIKEKEHVRALRIYC